MVEVAVHEGRTPGVERRIELPRERYQPGALALRLVEPGRDVVADPPEGRPGGPPQAAAQLDRDRRRLVVGKRRDVGPGIGALHQEGPAGRVAPQEADGAGAVPELEGVGLVVGLVVLGGGDLQDGIRPCRGDVGVAGEPVGRAELDAPVGGDVAGGCLQLAHPARCECVVVALVRSRHDR